MKKNLYYLLVLVCFCIGFSSCSDRNRVVGTWTAKTSINDDTFGMSESGAILTLKEDGDFDWQQVVSLGSALQVRMESTGKYDVDGDKVILKMSKENTRFDTERSIFPSQEEYDMAMGQLYETIFKTDQPHEESLTIDRLDDSTICLKDADGHTFYKVPEE